MAFLFNFLRKTEYIEEYRQVISFKKDFNTLLCKDSFIARKDYVFLIEKYKPIFEFFYNTYKADTLSYYCKQKKLKKQEIVDFINSYQDIADLVKGSSIVKNRNEQYIQKHL